MPRRELSPPETSLANAPRARARVRAANPAIVAAGPTLALLLVGGPVVAQTGGPVAVEPEVPSADSEAALRALETRVEGLERRLGASALLELVTRIERLTKEIQHLRDRTEVQARTLEGLRERQQDLYSELDRLARRVATSAPAGMAESPPEDAAETADSTTSGTELPGTDGQADEPTESADSEGSAVSEPHRGSPGATEPSPYDPVEEQTQYQRAFDLLSEGRFERAAAAFGEFLDDFPESRYRDDATFWQGECLYALRKFEPALERFTALVETNPESSRIPGAKLKIGFILHELGQSAEAAEVLRELVTTAPESSEAKLARDRLERLE